VTGLRLEARRRPERRRPGVVVYLAPGLLLAAIMVSSTFPCPAQAQLSGSNLLEAQAGNYPKSFPGRGPTNRQDLYDLLSLEYGFASGIAGLRFETDRNSQDAFPYEGITQRYVDWTDRRYRVRVGNFYTILGQGLIHRSFELTGVVLDQRFPRSRYVPSRDVDGVLVEANAGPIATVAFSGSPSSGLTSLAGEPFGLKRHAGQISGAQLVGQIRGATRVGAAYLRTTAGLGQQELGSGFLGVDPFELLGASAVSLPLYFEYAQADRSFGEWWKFKTPDRVPHALYASANLVWGPAGLSAEWKDYSQFRLGTNDPPSLVREHGQALLNRSTHVLNAGDEEGFQIEGTYRVAPLGAVTANFSRADGYGFRFDERFVELRAAPGDGEQWEATVFYDRSRDDIISIADRRTYGQASTLRFLQLWSVTLDLERLTARRRASGSADRFQDLYLSFTTARANWGSASFLWTRTSDRLDPSRFDPGTKNLHLVGGVLGAHLTQRHEATLFFGRRRGGLACTAGTCYEVQPFEGAELRLVSRF
jgi:Family of unknown function (DUF6029)